MDHDSFTERTLASAHTALARELTARAAAAAPPVELGFYGATFTALPGNWLERFLDLTATFRDAGVVAGARCSTRPDAVDPAVLDRLRDAGVHTVELGVQSFHDEVLAACRRGHDGAAARRGAELVRQAGLAAVLHLMAGLPGQTPSVFLADVAAALELHPAALRLHPTLVLAGTDLAALHARGEYAPWSLERAVRLLGRGLDLAWSRGVAVIRVGLCPEESLQRALVAGPWHPALGQRAASFALFVHIARRVRELAAAWPNHPLELVAPQRYRSDIQGWRGEQRRRWAALGLGPDQLRFEARNSFLLRARGWCTTSASDADRRPSA